MHKGLAGNFYVFWGEAVALKAASVIVDVARGADVLLSLREACLGTPTESHKFWRELSFSSK